jgi:hypothetical protein
MRKIAIIGNGKLLKKYGSKIDKCDTVIRFNHARLEGYKNYIGSKTDCLALVGATRLAFKDEADKIDDNILKSVSWVIFSGRKKNEEYEDYLIKRKFKLTGIEPQMFFTYIDINCFESFCKLHNIKTDENKIPSTGINVLCYILYLFSYKEKEKFFVCGFDQFESGHYFDKEQRNNANFHDLEAEKQVIKSLKSYSNITIGY